MQPDSSNILNQFCCENRVVLFLHSVVLSVINLRRACARVTVVVLFVCLSVGLSVCLSVCLFPL